VNKKKLGLAVCTGPKQEWFMNDIVKGKLMNERELRALWEEHLREGGPIRGWEEWKDKVGKAYSELTERAKELHFDEIPITYGELGGKIGLYIDSDWFRLKIGHIVGACSKYEYRHGRPLISALVVNKETNCPGKGFWGLEGIPPRLRKVVRIEDITPEWLDKERDDFWVRELRRIDKEWKTVKA
jgi:hypothetical protein